jgi:hypothetical protein
MLISPRACTLFDFAPDLIVCLDEGRDLLNIANSQEIANTPMPEKIQSLLSTAYVIRSFNEVISLIGEVITETLSHVDGLDLPEYAGKWHS